jgi:ribose/xylose/arabinose/galactoside ABC-type transport system permease subunit
MTDLADRRPIAQADSFADEPHPAERPLRRFVLDNRAALGSLVVFIVMMAVFLAANPRVFSTWNLYSSVLTTLPVAIFMTVPLVFVVTAGEIDLSFPATMGLASWAFALVVQAGYDPFLGMLVGIATGMVLGFFVGALVVYANLSSLVATLGMNFVLRGVILIINEGKSIALVSLRESWAYKIFSAQFFGVPIQVFWAIAFIVFSALLYNRHRFGVQVHVVGDNPDSARQMGIDVNRVRIKTFVFVGLGAALAGIFSTMINFTWWPTAGDGYLLPVLASVFVGGTPTWGGVGTVLGGTVGALTVAFIQTGIVGAGLSGFYVQFFNGLIIILSLLGHRWNQIRYR